MLCLVNVTEKIGSNSDFCPILSLSQCPWCRLFSTPGLCCLLSVTGESSQPLSDTFFHSWTLRLGRCIPGAAVTKYQGRRLKRTDIYFFTVMEARGLKSKRQQILPFRGSEGESVPCFSQLLVPLATLGVLWPVDPSHYCLPPSSHGLPLSAFSSLLRTAVTAFRAHQIHYDLDLITSAKIPFLNNHILRFFMDMILRGRYSKPLCLGKGAGSLHGLMSW